MKRGCELQRIISEATAELKQIKKELLPHFPCAKTHERLQTKFGVAERKVSNSYSVDAHRIGEVVTLLGDQTEQYIEEKRSYGVTAKMRQLLNDGDSLVAVSMRSIVSVRSTETITFKPAEGV